MNASVGRLKEVTVLYCEDEQDIREATKGILENFTYKQLVAEDGARGLELFKKYKDEIDLIITDINMPYLNGLEMVREIKKINSEIPIIIATAFSNSDYLLEAIDLGVNKYVLKPVNIKKLLNTMSQLLLYHELKNLYMDRLTRLPNKNALAKHIHEQSEALLALIDIDKFSVLNNLYSETLGDQILISLAEKIKQYFEEDYIIYRVGADKFIVLAKKYSKDEKELEQLSQTFLDDIENYGIKLNDYEVFLGITIAIAKSNDRHTYEYAQRIIQKARKQYIPIMIYDKDTIEQKIDYEDNIRWIKELKKGTTSGRFKPFFQPIVDAKTQEIFKYESLIRYIGDTGEEIAPCKFLPIAKKAKLYPIIMNIMLNGAINTIRNKNVRISVNISYEDIINRDTLKYIYKILEANPTEAKMLDFEILESEEIDNFNYVRTFIDKAREFGSRVGVDDFGAGYSNFNMLEALNIDFVKIDGSLIKDVDRLPKQALIVETIVNFCDKLGICTVAEFVSSKEIFDKVKELGIHYVQGRYFGKADDISSIK